MGVPRPSIVCPLPVAGDNGSKRKGEGQGQGQGQRDPETEADASGAEAPKIIPAVIDPGKVMFDAGLSLMAAAGIADTKARQLLGKWKRDHGAETVIIALGRAQREGAIDPISFIEGCLRNGQRNHHDRPSGWAPRSGTEGFEPASLDD
jgi:hypothetical protein